MKEEEKTIMGTRVQMVFSPNYYYVLSTYKINRKEV
jgi:hypothetical protein